MVLEDVGEIAPCISVFAQADAWRTVVLGAEEILIGMAQHLVRKSHSCAGLHYGAVLYGAIQRGGPPPTTSLQAPACIGHFHPRQ